MHLASSLSGCEVAIFPSAKVMKFPVALVTPTFMKISFTDPELSGPSTTVHGKYLEG